jgi:hypothetical protein
MNTEQILRHLREERDRLNRAIEALGSTSSSKGRARKKRSGGITTAGRKRLSELMRKRWAERRKKARAKTK